MPNRLPGRIETERLVLRAPKPEDAHDLFEAYTQDPDVARHMTWVPHTSIRETEKFVSECVEAWKTGSRLAYILEFKTQPHPIGMLDARIRETTIDIGYVLAKKHWGHGLMPEAIRGLVRVAFAESPCVRVQATCDVDNVASIRTLEKAGFAREGRYENYLVHPNLSPDPRACFMYSLCRDAGATS